MLVAVQLSVLGSYLPPVLNGAPGALPPQTIISLPVQTAETLSRGEGALVVLVALQLSVLGLYLPPVFKLVVPLNPPQTIISVPVQTAACESRALGALASVVGVHVSSVQTPEGLAITGSV